MSDVLEMDADWDAKLKAHEDALGRKLMIDIAQMSTSDREAYLDRWRRALLENDNLPETTAREIISARQKLAEGLSPESGSRSDIRRQRMH